MHTGSIWGMSAIVGLLPEENLGMVALLNCDHAELRHALMYTVFDRYLGRADQAGSKDWSADLLAFYRATAEEDTAEEPGPSQPPRLPLDAYVGTYTHDLYGALRVTLEPSGLVLQWAGPAGSTADLTHLHFDTFRVVYRDTRLGNMVIRFGLGADGQVRELEIVGLKTFRRMLEATD